MNLPAHILRGKRVAEGMQDIVDEPTGVPREGRQVGRRDGKPTEKPREGHRERWHREAAVVEQVNSGDDDTLSVIRPKIYLCRPVVLTR